MSQQVSIERIQCWVKDVSLQHAFAEIIEYNYSDTASQPAKGGLVEFGPDS